MRNNENINEVNSIFEQPWWLDAVAPNRWKEIILEENGQPIARWSYAISNHKIYVPDLTQTLGIWIAEQKDDACRNKLKKILNDLLKIIPKGCDVKIQLDSNNQYFLPFMWNGFTVIPKVSYRINDLSDISEVYGRFNNIVKKNIKGASHKVSVQESLDILPLYALMEKTFKLQGRNYGIPKSFLLNLFAVIKKRNAGKLLYAIDNDGNYHSGALFVYDSNRCYYLVAGTDPMFRSSGANTLLIWEGIKFASTVSNIFDFEGSVIEGIEAFYRQFGGEPSIYYEIRRRNFVKEVFEILKPRIKKTIHYK